MADLDTIVEIAKNKLSALITKPKMSEKLLSKPPFRFLHDTISSISATTGFGEGLYSDGELDSASITEKQAKIDYLEKAFNLVGICKGTVLDVRAAKVVSGLEPENTNHFLIALADCAADSKYDSSSAVRMVLEGKTPGSVSPPLKNSNIPIAESKSGSVDQIGSKSQMNDDHKGNNSSSTNRKGGGEKEVESKISVDMERSIAPDRGKSRSGTRGGKPNQATLDVGLSGGTTQINLDSQIEKCDGTESTTQVLLGEVIQRPKLTDKLLSKPPFRFLHDIVVEVVKVTGFGRNLYTESELDSANISEKNQKLEFLEKIIKLVGIQLNTLVVANPAKIVAGRDPQDTNNFLQLLAVASKNIPDSRNAVRTVLEQYGQSNNNMDTGPSNNQSSPVNIQKPLISSPIVIEQQQQPLPQKSVSSNVPSSHHSNDMAKEQNNFKESMMTADEKISAPENVDEDDEKRSSRPTTARRRPPKVKDGAKEVHVKDIIPNATKKTTGIIIDGQNDDDDDEDIAFIPDETRLVDQMNTNNINNDAKMSNADPQSKLVKDIMSRQIEQETIARGPKVNESIEETKAEVKDGSSGVGIRLGRLRKTGQDSKSGSTTTANSGANGAIYNETDLEKMRKSIQTLVQHTGPLGTCMDYIQEDVSLMTAELHRWEEECRKYEIDYEESKRKTKELLHPLKLQLADFDDQIYEAISKVSSMKAINVRNDDKIQQILKLSSTA